MMEVFCMLLCSMVAISHMWLSALEMWVVHHQMLARMWSNRNPHSSLLGMQNGVAMVEDSLAVSLKPEHIHNI